MKRNIMIVVSLLVVAGAVAVLMMKQKKVANLSKPQMPIPSVQDASVNHGTLEVTAHYLATIEPLIKSDLSPRISGNILFISKREGDQVRQGELLVSIDERELLDRSLAVNSEVLATRQRLVGAQSAYTTQKAVFERDVTLHKAGAISKEALDRSQSAVDSAKATVDAYQESLKGLARNTSVAKTQAGYARINAPFSGVISKRWSEQGDLATPGKPILTIEKTSSYKILAQVPQEELAGIRPGTKVILTHLGQTMPAKVNRIYPSLGKNMLATVEVLTSEAPFGLPSLATIGFDIITKKLEGIIAPDQAVVKSKQGAFVYQVRDGIIHIKPVKILGMGGGKLALEGELTPGGILAVAQENKLLTFTEGSKVTPIDMNIPAPSGGGVK